MISYIYIYLYSYTYTKSLLLGQNPAKKYTAAEKKTKNGPQVSALAAYGGLVHLVQVQAGTGHQLHWALLELVTCHLSPSRNGGEEMVNHW